MAYTAKRCERLPQPRVAAIFNTLQRYAWILQVIPNHSVVITFISPTKAVHKKQRRLTSRWQLQYKYRIIQFLVRKNYVVGANVKRNNTNYDFINQKQPRMFVKSNESIRKMGVVRGRLVGRYVDR